MEKKGIIEEYTTIINPQKISGAVSSSDEMEHFLHTVIDTLPGVISCSCNTILSRIKDINFLKQAPSERWMEIRMNCTQQIMHLPLLC